MRNRFICWITISFGRRGVLAAYETPWDKTSVGLNYYVKQHDIKYQLTYQMGANKDGKKGADVDEVYLQAQYVF